MARTDNNFEGGTPTVAIDTANSGGVSGVAWNTPVPGTGGSILYTSDAFYTGKVAGIITPNPAGGTSSYLERTIGGSRSGAGTFRWKFATLPTTGQAIIRACTSTGTTIVGIGINNVGQMFTTNGSGGNGVALTGSCVAGVWYKTEWWWSNPTTTTGVISIRTYRGDNATPEITIDETAQNNGTSTSGLIRVGKPGATGIFPGAIVLDEVAYDDGTLTPPALSLPSPDAYYTAIRGTTVNTTAGTTTVVSLPTGASIAANSYLVMRIACDNAGSGGIAPGITTITDTALNVWTSTTAAVSDPGLVNEGVACYIAYAKRTNAYANGNSITITWSTSVTAKSVVVEEWANIDTVAPVAVTATTNQGVASTAVTSTTITPLAANQLVYVATAIEGPAGEPFPLDTDSTDGTWKALQSQSTIDATATNNVTIRGGVKRVTGTTAQQWNSTLTTARDWATVALVFGVPAAPTPLDTPTGLTITVSTSARSATANWNSVVFADSYLFEVQVLDVGGNPLIEGDWSPLTPATTFPTTGLGVTIDDGDGLEWSRSYRGRVTAIAP